MKTLLAFGFVLGCLSVSKAAEPKTQVSRDEVRRLTIAVALLDYPIEQSKVRDAVGIPNGVDLSWGSSENEGSKRGSYWYWPLLNTPDGSSFALKVFYSADSKKTTGRYPLITAIEVVYQVENVGSFVADPNDYPLLNVSRLKVMMKRDGLTPKEITDPQTLGKYWEETLRDRENEFQKRPKK
ncbi:MAG TPA: hypothetical protein VGM64_10185 [Lacunisphaera sp.]|jgi:hypothetical protein